VRVHRRRRLRRRRLSAARCAFPPPACPFDDTLARVLGSSLEALNRETELILSTDTYRERSLSSVRLPGLLLSELAFTL